jgi:hypothetical protein
VYLLLCVSFFVGGYAADSADGQLARVAALRSERGLWLDHVLDGVRIVLVRASMLLALVISPADFDVAAGAIAVLLCGETLLYLGPLLSPAANPSIRRSLSEQRWTERLREICLVPLDSGVLAFVPLVFLSMQWNGTLLVLVAAYVAAVSAALFVREYRRLSPVALAALGDTDVVAGHP